jgi:hypothetical protein
MASIVLIRGLPPEVTAEVVLSKLKHREYPLIHVRQLRRKTYNENLQQSNSVFLPLHVITHIAEKNTRNIRDRTGFFHFKVHTENYTGLSCSFQCYGVKTLVIKFNFALLPQNVSNVEKKTFPVRARNLNMTI